MKKSLLGSSALAGASGLTLVIALGLAQDSRADDECGPANAGDTVTCTPAGNDFPGGIQYQVVDLTIVVEDGVIIDTTGVAGEPGGIVSGDFNFGDLVVKAGTSGGTGVTITTDGSGAEGIDVRTVGTATIISFTDISTSGTGAEGISSYGDAGVAISSTGTITTKGTGADGIHVYSVGGSVSVTSAGAIATSGEQSYGITAIGYLGATVISNGDIATKGGFGGAILGFSSKRAVSVTSTGDLSTEGKASAGIYAYSKGAGTGVTVTSTGDITTQSNDSRGILARSDSGGVSVSSTGDVATQGAYASAIFADGYTFSTVSSKGDISTQGAFSTGISSFSSSGTSVVSVGDITTSGSLAASGITAAAVGGTVTISSNGDISTAGINSFGISGSVLGGTVVIISSGKISTGGIGAAGIGGGAFAGSIVVSSDSDISTMGSEAHGISAGSSSGASATVASGGDISTRGEEADGLHLFSRSGDLEATSAGNITTAGKGADGISANADGIIVVTSTGTISATGQYASGILAQSYKSTTQISVNGRVQGGWDGAAAGIFVGSDAGATLDVLTDGTVGALSDRAIFSSAGAVQITNSGTITGYVQLSDGADMLKNVSSDSFNLRHFEDTDGDGVRDKEFVAIADFGADVDDFDNVGTLRLSNVSGASAWDTTGQITHPGGGNAEITQDGVEQGFLTNLETFTHSGLITLQDGVAGDLLVITDQADGATAGTNTFTSNGGRLALDVTLDDGASGQSDVLVLDKAVTGTGATSILVAGVGSSGGDTGTGDGILVVNVRTASDADAFVLGNNPVAGAYQYDLFFQNQAATDQNWYLRSSFFEGALEYPAITTGALLTWYSDLGPLHERLGEVRRATEAGQTATFPLVTTAAGDTSAVRMSDGGQAGWFRVMGADMDIEQDGPADFDLDTVRAEAGFDVGFDNLLDRSDWLVLGAFAGYGWSSLGFQSGADIDFDIATIGAYATYFRGPYYLDALVKFDWLDGDYNSDAVSQDGDVEIPVIGLSLETGYRFDLTDGGLYLQPQAQLAYAHAGGDGITDDSGAEIKLEDADSLRGRLGARLGQELGTIAGAAAEPVKGNFYVEASVNQEFLGETEAKVSGLRLEQDLPDTTFEIGAGFDIALPKNGVTFTIDADYTFGDDIDGIGATGGIRINW